MEKRRGTGADAPFGSAALSEPLLESVMKPSAPLSLGAASEPPRSVSRRTASAARNSADALRGVHPAKLRAGQAPVGAARGVAGHRVPESERRRASPEDAAGVASTRARLARAPTRSVVRKPGGAPAARTTPRARRRRRDARERPRRARARAPSARRAASRRRRGGSRGHRARTRGPR